MWFPSLAAVPDQDDDITLKTLLDHMQNMQRAFTLSLQEVRKDLRSVERHLTHHIDRVEANITLQIGGIDKRLDSVEIEKLPQRVTKIELALAAR